MIRYYQRQVKRANQNKIIQLLNQKPLTFKELIERSGLSRAAVNGHLKTLKEKGLVKKTYDRGKILNVLQPSKLDLVEWLIDQLRALRIPEDLLNKGKDALDKTVVALSILYYYGKIMYDTQLFGQIKLAHVKGKAEKVFALPSFKTLSKIDRTVAVKLPELIPKQPKLRDRYRRWTKVLRELTPFTFHIALIIYEYEKAYCEKGIHKKSILCVYSYLDDATRQAFDKALQWWKEVEQYIPGGCLFHYLTSIYFDKLLGKEKEMEKLYADEPLRFFKIRC